MSEKRKLVEDEIRLHSNYSRLVREVRDLKWEVDADIYDIYDLILEFSNGSISNILVDLIQRRPDRIFRLCENGIIRWDWMTDTGRSYNVSENK